MGVADSILRQISGLGYAVSMHRVNDTIELHTVRLSDPSEQHIARSVDGDSGEDEYKTACVLAEMVGIDLEDA